MADTDIGQAGLLIGARWNISRGIKHEVVNIMAPVERELRRQIADPRHRVAEAVGPRAALLHGGFERGDGAVVESFTQRARNRLARVCAFG